MRLKEQRAHQGIYRDKQWQVRLCGAVGLGAPVPDSQPSLDTAQAQDVLCWRHGAFSAAQGDRAQCRVGLARAMEEGSAEGTVLGTDWESAPSPGATSPKGCTDFLGKPRKGAASWSVLGAVMSPRTAPMPLRGERGYRKGVSGIFHRCLCWLWFRISKGWKINVSFPTEPRKLAPPTHHL